MRLRKPSMGWILLAALLLVSCGQLSLMNLMQTEEPGDFSVQPAEAALVEGASIDLLPQGGFRPYTPLVLTGVGTLVDGVYTADVGAGGHTVTIDAVDALGHWARSTLKIFSRLSINPSSATLPETDTQLFTAAGGTPPYDFHRNGTLVAPGVDQWLFPASAPGSYLVEVEDGEGMRAAATVTVVQVGGQIAISPTSVAVVAGGTVVFQALNASGSQVFAVDSSVDPPGYFADPTANPATYQAPGWRRSRRCASPTGPARPRPPSSCSLESPGR